MIFYNNKPPKLSILPVLLKTTTFSLYESPKAESRDDLPTDDTIHAINGEDMANP